MEPRGDGSTSNVAFQRERVALFGLVGGSLGFGFWVFRLVAALALGVPGYALTPEMVYHLLAAAILLALWPAARWTQSAATTGWLEVGGILLSSVAYQLMGAHIDLANLRPDLTTCLALSYGMVARAVFVPSGALRTLAITATVGALHLVVLGASGRPQQIYEAAGVASMASSFEIDGAGFAVGTLMENAAWWTATALLCGAISRVLYGLRQEVRAARRLGQYALEEKIGEGGMGVVYRARHTLLRRPTAVKLLPPEKAGEQAIARFEREVRLAARLTHPNTVTIFDYGRTPEGVFYYAMELLEGADLLEIVRADGPQPAERVVHVLDQVCGSLAEAHAAGLIHRDVKPANVILCERGGVPDVAKVVDFGLARTLSGDDGRLTASTGLTGTPLYMPPEAISAPERVDERSDLYSLGAVAYFLLAGEDVFTGRNAVEVCSHHLHTTPTPLADRTGGQVPPVLDRIVLECLAKRPEDRPRSALALRDRLRETGLRPWGEWEAREWWDERGSALRRRRATSAPSGLTLAVDLEGRGTPAADSASVTRER